MHTQPMAESEGEFTEEDRMPVAKCPKCKKFSVYYKVWESSCGGYEDTKYTCSECDYYRWVDGPDS
jgi:DNA-directed RNA polymerase subunit M/transcription elongation factor TFIIS